MKYTNDVFQRLSRGQFISSNSIDPEVRAIYNDIEECQAEYEDFFAKIDFVLSAGDGYYYFSRREPKVATENKLRGLLPWIDILDFLKTYDTSFGAGTQFNSAHIEVRVSSDPDLKDKLAHLFTEKNSVRDKLDAIVEMLTKQGYAEEVNPAEGMYQVTTAFRYIENLMDCINIDEEVKDEIPE